MSERTYILTYGDAWSTASEIASQRSAALQTIDKMFPYATCEYVERNHIDPGHTYQHILLPIYEIHVTPYKTETPLDTQWP